MSRGRSGFQAVFGPLAPLVFLPRPGYAQHIMSEVSRILAALAGGDARAARDLLPLVYDELRRLAAQKLAHEAAGQTLQPTALVHEAYLRLVGDGGGPAWEGRRHFFAA